MVQGLTQCSAILNFGVLKLSELFSLPNIFSLWLNSRFVESVAVGPQRREDQPRLLSWKKKKGRRLCCDDAHHTNLLSDPVSVASGNWYSWDRTRCNSTMPLQKSDSVKVIHLSLHVLLTISSQTPSCALYREKPRGYSVLSSIFALLGSPVDTWASLTLTVSETLGYTM